MAQTVRDLLNNALTLSIRDRQFDPVETEDMQLTLAGNLLLEITDVYRYQIPFWDVKQLNTEADLENLGVSDINFVHYLIGTTRQVLQMLEQASFEAMAAVIDLRAIPQYAYFDRQNDQIRVYPLPPAGDARFIIGFKPLNSLTMLDVSIPPSLPLFAIAFLRYQVAMEICNYYGVPWSPQKEATRQNYYRKLLSNGQNRPAQQFKAAFGRRRYPVPWLAYLSGNTPGN